MTVKPLNFFKVTALHLVADSSVVLKRLLLSSNLQNATRRAAILFPSAASLTVEQCEVSRQEPTNSVRIPKALLAQLSRACQLDLEQGTAALTRQAWLDFQHYYPWLFQAIDALLEERNPYDKPYDEV
jgi:hypothetical protein